MGVYQFCALCTNRLLKFSTCLMMLLLQKESEETIKTIKSTWKGIPLAKSLQQQVLDVQTNGSSPTRSGSFVRATRHVAGFGTQLKVLLQRECRSVIRNKGILGARYGMTVFLSVMYGWLFAGTGRVDLQRDAGSAFAADFQAHLGSLLSLSIA